MSSEITAGCDHSYQREEFISGYYDYYGDWVDDAHWKRWEETACVDLDTNRFQCKKCQKIMYYNGTRPSSPAFQPGDEGQEG